MCISFGMGLDSVKIIHEYMTVPGARDFDWSRCLAVTSMTGNEYEATESAMNRVVLPWFREVGLRYVQIARAGQSKSAGYEILDDSTAPRRMFMRGNHWRLSDELLRAGTVPQVAHGRRICSARAKGDQLDAFMADEIAAGRLAPDFRHVIGFSADEQARALRDSTYGTNSRNPEYPLITWDYDRQACDAMLEEALGFRFPRSCCLWCPFQFAKAGRAELVARWRAEPGAGAQALAVARHGLALNPRMLLFGSIGAHEVAYRENLHEVADLYDEWEKTVPAWSVYEVRRGIDARKDGKGRNPRLKGSPWRSVKTVATTGEYGEAREVLAELARDHRVGIERTGKEGIERAWLRRYPAVERYPMTERFYVVSEAGTDDKKRPGFEEKWHAFTQPKLVDA
ncbi:hypothetical protein CU254_41885 (plasmid) [Amycolatopsis sp. AA4]|nr:hypothetical protein CU254_41885 [Amycolatopsis sp. AA4]